MKKIFTAFLAIVVICILLALGDVALNQQKTGGGKQTLTIYNWGDYIDPALITKFEHQTGYHVDYETFDSNESMLTKIRQGGTNYDVVVPSEYTVQRMKKERFKNCGSIYLRLGNFRWLRGAIKCSFFIR